VTLDNESNFLSEDLAGSPFDKSNVPNALLVKSSLATKSYFMKSGIPISSSATSSSNETLLRGG
jgi:hypothetical protein